MANKFRCPYCNKSYARESWFRKHECEKRKRFDESHNMDFLRGLRMFTHWYRRLGYLRKGKEVTDKTFIDSPYYNSFMKLAKYTTDNWVVTGHKYLDFLIDFRIPEAKWMTEETLKQYRENLRRHEDALSQTRVTCEAIKSWCKKHEINIAEFFAKITPGSALQMIVSNQLSPWVLFGYDRSVSDLLARMNADWLCVINEYINNTYWINKIKSSEDTKHVIQEECDRMMINE